MIAVSFWDLVFAIPDVATHGQCPCTHCMSPKAFFLPTKAHHESLLRVELAAVQGSSSGP